MLPHRQHAHGRPIDHQISIALQAAEQQLQRFPSEACCIFFLCGGRIEEESETETARLHTCTARKYVPSVEGRVPADVRLCPGPRMSA